MIEPASPEFNPTSPSKVGRLERACDRFEEAWKAGQRPTITNFLTDQDGREQPFMLRELLVLDIAYRRRTGERPAPEDYLRHFPTDAAVIDSAFAEASGDLKECKAPSFTGFPGPVPAIPGYTVLCELGRGGMGVVFKARQQGLNRLVALKMILAGDLAGPEAAARFLAEAEAVARLQHPQVVQIYRIGDHGGRPFLEMEYVAGGSLADRLDGTPWAARDAARLIESLARAVQHAHSFGIVHRDLKPANILLTIDGLPKLTDFGLAKSLGADVGLTQTGSIIGSPSYMAPEQAEGGRQAVGPAVDVYALGAVLYEQLTGRPPFKAATILQTLEQVRSAEPAAPSKLQPGLALDIETIVLKCLQKDPQRRYTEAAALAEDLRRFSAGEPILARPVGALERGFKWARRRPLIAALSAVSVLSTVLLTIVLAITNVIISQERQQILESLGRERLVKEELVQTNNRIAQQQQQTEVALQGKIKALEERTDDLFRERQSSYYQRISLAEDEHRSGRIGRAEQVLDACPHDLRGWEWHFLKRFLNAGPITLRGHTGEVWDAVFSPDGRTVASASFDLTAKVWDTATGRERHTLRGHTARLYSVAFSPDATRLVTASADQTAIVWDVSRGRKVHVLKGHTNNVRCARFSPNGRWIATGSWDDTIRIWDARTGETVRVIPTGAGQITRLTFSPDGSWIAVGGTSSVAQVWEFATGRLIQTFRGHSEHVLSVSFSPDGRRVASTSGSPGGGAGVVKIWDVVSGREVLAIDHPPGILERVAYSPDGLRLATSGWDGTVKLWEAESGLEILGLHSHSGRVWGVTFSPDGGSLISAAADGTVVIWDANPPDRSKPRSAGPVVGG